MTNVAAERDAFEAWYARRHPKPTHENSTWAHCAKMDDWEVWQARAGAAPAAVAPQGEEWRRPTTYLQRFGDAIALLCQGRRPDDQVLTSWLDGTSDVLQQFAVDNGPAWAQGIGLIDAATIAADQPTEGVAHEMRADRTPALEAPAAPETPPQTQTDAQCVAAWRQKMQDEREGDAVVAMAFDAGRASAAAPQAPRLGEDALHLLRRLLSNQHTLTGPEFRSELEKIVAEESARHAAAPQAPAAPVGEYTLVDEGGPVELAGAQAQYSIERADGSTAAWILGDGSAVAELMAALRMPVSGANAAAPAAPAVDAPVKVLSQAARDVLAERRRQVEAEGFSPERDDQYVGGQLAGAATSYLILAAGGREDEARAFWPWRQEWLKPGSQRRYLEKACALGLAEMERQDRAAAQAAAKGEHGHG